MQIWFQNRRQNDRRKARPLTPQEIEALRYGGMQVLSHDMTSPLASQAGHVNLSPLAGPDVSPSAVQGVPGAQLTPQSDGEHSPHGAHAPASPSPQTGNFSGPFTFESSSLLDSSAVGYLANRWNPGTARDAAMAPSFDRGLNSSGVL
jgi:hypothetical protein